MARENSYSLIIGSIFEDKYSPGMGEVEFERKDIVKAAHGLGIETPKNLGDLVYSFRYRTALPDEILATAAEGKVWIIRPAGRGQYRLVLVPDTPIAPNVNLAETKVPDATPGIVAKYAFNDEQALLAMVRYNRLLDIFTGVACYSLQNHLRTTVPDMGQVETDEVYVGIDKRGMHYAFPVQAKGGSDRLSVVQIEQDFAMCAQKLPALVARPVAAQFMSANLIALFEFEMTGDGVAISSEQHYRLVPPEEVTDADLACYRLRHS
jgi:hypothetical protein